MRVKKLVASFGVAALISGGLVLAATSPASAHTSRPVANCDGLSVSETNFAAERPATKDVTETQWKYVEHGGSDVKWVDNNDFKYVDSQGHGTDHKPWHGTYYERTSDTRTVVVKKGQPAAANHITVTVDGSVPTDTDFGTTFVKSYASPDPYSAHTYTVKVTAWDNSRYDLDWSQTVQACKTNPQKPTTPPSYTEWTDQGTPQCGDTTIEQTRVKTTYTYELVDHKWIEHTSTSTETQTRDLTADELATLQDECSIPATPIVPVDASALVKVHAPTCDAAGFATFGQVNATWADPVKGDDGSYTRVATAKDGHLFNVSLDGVSADGKTMTMSYTLQPQEDCIPATPINKIDASAAVTTSDATCDLPGQASFTQANVTWADAAQNEDGSWSRVATADSGHMFKLGEDGVSEDGTTKTVTYSLASKLDCIPWTGLTPATPTQPTGPTTPTEPTTPTQPTTTKPASDVTPPATHKVTTKALTVTPKAKVATPKAVSSKDLAVTGVDVAWTWILGAGLAALVGLAMVLEAARRRKA